MMEMLELWLGPLEGQADLGIREMVLRAVIIFTFAVALVRIGSTRFMSRNSAFDLILAIMLGSILSRAITGQSGFFPTLVAGTVIVVLHSIFALLAARFDIIGNWVKGRSSLLVKDGELVPGALLKNRLGEGDLREALRLNGHFVTLEDVKMARLERNGEISLIFRDRKDQDEGGNKDEAPPS